jgi:hypothetical protein
MVTVQSNKERKKYFFPYATRTENDEKCHVRKKTGKIGERCRGGYSSTPLSLIGAVGGTLTFQIFHILSPLNLHVLAYHERI